MDRLAIDLMSIIQAAALAIVAIVIGLFVIRPLLARPPSRGLSQLPVPPGPASGTETDPARVEPALMPLTGEIEEGEFDPGNMAVVSDAATDAEPGVPALDQAAGMDPVQRLRNLIGERQEETVEILRTWLEGEEEKA